MLRTKYHKIEIECHCELKGNGIERGSYRGLKLLEHMMKVFERVIIQKMRAVVGINVMQFGLMPRKGTTNANFPKCNGTRL